MRVGNFLWLKYSSVETLCGVGFSICWNLSSRTTRTLVSTATRIWGESGLCLRSCVWHLHLVLVPVRKQRGAELSTFTTGGQLDQPFV